MTRINLYPWRIDKEEKSKQEFIILLAITSIISLLIMLIINWVYTMEISNQAENNDYLNKELIITNKQLREISEIKIQKNALISRLSVIQELEKHRYSTINILNELVKIVNPLVVLSNIKRDGDVVKVTGFAQSNAEVAKFLRSLELSQYFRTAELDQIKIVDSNNSRLAESKLFNFFEVRFYQDNLKINQEQDSNV